jgi:RNA polymerase sigma-70 factor (sigma-E family)
VAKGTDAGAYREYVSGRLDQLRRTAYLLCGDWHTADDLTSTALVKLYRHWRTASAAGNLDAYVRRILLNAWLDERRRPWHRERSSEHLPEPPADRAAATDGATDRITDRVAVLAMLAELPPRRRAVLVLRYFCDLSVEDTAEVLGCSTGTIKSQTARALDALRGKLVGVTVTEEDPLWT